VKAALPISERQLPIEDGQWSNCFDIGPWSNIGILTNHIAYLSDERC
jgi:hypothetical protein